MEHSFHIVIACSYLHVPGGYEKAMVTTANLFARKGNKVTLLILDEPAGIYYPLDKKVGVVRENLNFGITAKGNTISRKIKLWKDIRKLRRILKTLRPSLLITTEYPFSVAAIQAGAKKFTKVFSWEHHHFGSQQMNRFWRFLFRRAYRKLDAVVCLNSDEQQFYLSLNNRAARIPNFIEPGGIENVPAHKKYSLISVTRFNAIKGIDLLMEVAKRVCKKNNGLTWKVIGYGEQKEKFLAFIESEDLSSQLVYQDAEKPDILNEYRESSLFVLVSRNECFPLVLLEAMDQGLPCVAFDCETGPRHIIRPGETGILVSPENVDGMSDTILDLLQDENKKRRMSDNAREAIRSFYPDEVYKSWAKLFADHFGG